MPRKLSSSASAIASYDAELKLAPRHAHLLTNQAVALRRLDRPHEALLGLNRALIGNPDFAEARFVESLVRLTLGDFAAGWSAYEQRWATAALKPHRRNFSRPLWLGDAPLAGKTILLYVEQGFGDTIQFVRYAPRVAALGARVILEVQAELARLMAAAFKDIEADVRISDRTSAAFCQKARVKSLGQTITAAGGAARLGRVAFLHKPFGSDFRIGAIVRPTGQGSIS
jgi:hypothetical protein